MADHTKQSLEQLIAENELLKEIIQVQHDTINRLMDTYIPHSNTQYPSNHFKDDFTK